MESLSEAGAFDSITSERRSALWDVRGLAVAKRSPMFADAEESQPAFEALSDFEKIGWDYASSHHSARGHPPAPLRAELTAM